MPEAEGSTEPLTASILVIEDSETIRALIVSYLENSGHQVIEAADGETGLALFDARVDPVDLVLCDVLLPGISGPVVVSAMLTGNPDLRVIFMSGSSPEPEVTLVPNSTFLPKPFRLAALGEAVANALS